MDGGGGSGNGRFPICPLDIDLFISGVL